MLDWLDKVIWEAKDHATREDNLDARRIWLRLETAAEELLVHYGGHTDLRDKIREEVMQEMRDNLQLLQPEPEPVEEVKKTLWQRIRGG